MLSWIFGDIQDNKVHLLEKDKASGFLQLKRARVRWFLSIDANTLPKEIKEKGQRTYRSITVEGEEIEFSEGFTDLHNISYNEILAGRGFGLKDAYQCINIVYEIRKGVNAGLINDYHPLMKNIK